MRRDHARGHGGQHDEAEDRETEHGAPVLTKGRPEGGERRGLGENGRLARVGRARLGDGDVSGHGESSDRSPHR